MIYLKYKQQLIVYLFVFGEILSDASYEHPTKQGLLFLLLLCQGNPINCLVPGFVPLCRIYCTLQDALIQHPSLPGSHTGLQWESGCCCFTVHKLCSL